MHRALLAAFLLVATAFSGGCRSCQSPYDYTGPVADCQCESCCGGGGRAGSVISGGQVVQSPQIDEYGGEYDSYGETMVDEGPMMME